MSFSFMATIGGDANPLRKELRSLEDHSKRTGKKITDSLGGGIASAIAMRFGGFAAVFKGVQFIGDAIQADIAMQRIKNTLEAASRSASQAASDFKFLWSESNRIGFSFLENANAFARFEVAAKAANLTATQTRDVFIAVQEAALVMGLTTDQAGAVMLALEQMMSKGTVMSQELRLQLGNAMPGAMDTFARALGVTQAELYKLVEAGNVLARDAVPKFAAELKKSFNLTDEANKTIRDINRMKNAWLELKAEIGELSRPITTQVLHAGTGIAKLLQGTAFKQFYSMGGGYKQEMTEEQAQARISAMEKTMADARELAAKLESGKMKPWIANLTADPKEAEKMMEKADDITRRTAEITEKNRLDALTKEERLKELSRLRLENETRIAALRKETVPSATATLSIAELRLRNAEIDGMIQDLKRDKPERLARSSSASFATSSQESHGLFGVGVGNNPVLSVNQSMDRTLKEIKMALIKPAYVRSSRRGVNFGGATR